MTARREDRRSKPSRRLTEQEVELERLRAALDEHPALAAALGGDPVDRLVYRSNLLGADQRITNTGGGNTSSKLSERASSISPPRPECATR